MRQQTKNWEEIFAEVVYDKGQLFKIYVELLTQIRKQAIWVKSVPKTFTDTTLKKI